MKKQLLYLMLLCFSAVNAQVVNIPNAALKTVLISQVPLATDSNGESLIIDANNDGEIQVSEAQNVWRLSFGNYNLENLNGIEVFENLRYLNCSSNNLSSLNLQDLQHLEELWCEFNEIVTLDLSNISTLKKIFAGFNKIADINISGLPNLDYLGLENNKLTSLDYSGCVNLEALVLGSNHFSSFTLAGLNNLTHFGFYDMLQPVNKVTIANLPSLQHLDLGFGNIQALELVDLPDLTELIANDNSFTYLDLSPYLNLTYVYLRDTGLIYLNAKNFDGPYIDLQYNSQLEVICLDEEQIAGMTDILYSTESLNLQVVTVCPDITLYNTINGYIKFDVGSDGCDVSDITVPLKKMNITTGNTTKTIYTNNSGIYNFPVFTGSYTITPQTDNEWSTVSPASADVNFTDVDNNIESVNFCMSVTGLHHDVQVLLVPISDARPGFDATYKIIYKNVGTQAESGTITLNFDDNVTDFISANPASSTFTAGTRTWNFANLPPFATREILITLNVNGPMDTPAINIGAVLNYAVTISIPETDENPGNNVMGLKQVVVGSFDPNDITCLEGDTKTPDAIGDYLHYNINFENTGDAAATFIVVENDINELQYDINSLEILYASHEMTATVEDNMVRFRFDDINLGAEGKGNVTYKIKTNATLQEGDAVTQKANIFFDYNFPIATNEATTVFEAALRSNDFSFKNNLKIYPNPSSGIVHIVANTGLQSIELYDIQGRLLQAVMLNTTEATIDISKRASGIYFMKVKTEQGIKVQKLVRQ